MNYECISLLINLLEEKDYHIDNANLPKNFLHCIMFQYETTLIKRTFFCIISILDYFLLYTINKTRRYHTVEHHTVPPLSFDSNG